MNKRNQFYIVTAIVAAFTACNAVATTSVPATGGIISFNGAVSDTTCNVTTNNGADFTVNVSPIAKSDLGTTVGVVSASATPFTLNVSDCTGFDATSTAAQSLEITFSGSNVSDDMTYLKNESGTAQGVGIAITADGASAVKLGTAMGTGLTTTQSGNTVYDTGAAGAINLYANYYNYGGVSASTGSVVTTATYSFNYE